MIDLGTTTPWRRTAVFPEYRDRSLVEVFRELATVCADRTAARDAERSLSYRELYESIGAVAAALRDSRPVGRGESDNEPWVVTAVVGHGIDALLTVYGVMAAGAVLVPIDAIEPVERIALIHRVGGATLAVSATAHAGRAREAVGCRTLLLEDLLDDATRRACSTADSDPAPGALAMVNFTSGSTGAPRGVVRDHASLVRAGFTTAQSTLIEADDVVAFTGSFSFIGASRVSLGALVVGAELCIHDPRVSGRDLAEWIGDRGISVLNFIPSVLRNFTDIVGRAGAPRMDSVKIVTLGGETTYGRDIARARALFGPDTRFVSRFGSSETGVLAEWAATADDEVRSDEPLPIGRPLPWAHITVVDDAGQTPASGVVGVAEAVSEHCSLGYWNDPQLTAERFWNLSDGRRGFRMSDRVRMRDDGVLEHVARADDRVKVRGVMVSPSEVERALTALSGVSNAAVVAAPGRDGGTRLVGYVVSDAHTELSTLEIRRAMAAAMPSAMVPGSIVRLESLPLTTRGKVDRHALASPPDPTRPYREPIGREAWLADAFSTILSVDRVGRDDDFFELGGDSLAVVELQAVIADRFGIEVPASTVTEAPTPAELYLRLSHRRPRNASPVVVLRSDGADPPVFFVTGGGMPAMTLRLLSAAVPGRNFAAIQPRGLEERAIPDHSVEAAARRNVTAMRAVQPHGPYLLGGFSSGGRIAFEMACRLRATGEEVGLLVLIDTVAPGFAPGLADRARSRAQTLHASVPHSSAWRAAVVAGRTVRFAVQSAYAHCERRVALTTAGVVPRRGYKQYRLFMRLQLHVSNRYLPSSTFDGPTFVVRSAGADGTAADIDDQPPRPQYALADLGWSRFVTGPLTSIDLPVGHMRMLARPTVGLVGAHVAAALDEAATAGTS